MIIPMPMLMISVGALVLVIIGIGFIIWRGRRQQKGREKVWEDYAVKRYERDKAEALIEDKNRTIPTPPRTQDPRTWVERIHLLNIESDDHLDEEFMDHAMPPPFEDEHTHEDYERLTPHKHKVEKAIDEEISGNEDFKSAANHSHAPEPVRETPRPSTISVPDTDYSSSGSSSSDSGSSSDSSDY